MADGAKVKEIANRQPVVHDEVPAYRGVSLVDRGSKSIMIGEVLVFLKDHLNDTLNAASDWTSGESREDKVVFVDGEKMDPIVFKLGAVSALLINVEEDNTLRAADQYAAVSADGAAFKVQPEIRINLFVLFVARFKQYEQGLKYLSQIIQHFQSHRVFDHHTAPELSEGNATDHDEKNKDCDRGFSRDR